MLSVGVVNIDDNDNDNDTTIWYYVRPQVEERETEPGPTSPRLHPNLPKVYQFKKLTSGFR